MRRIFALALVVFMVGALPSSANDASPLIPLPREVHCWGAGDTVHMQFYVYTGEIDTFKLYIGLSNDVTASLPTNYFHNFQAQLPNGPNGGYVIEIPTNHKVVFDYYWHNGIKKDSRIRFYDWQYPAVGAPNVSGPSYSCK